ncbi:hypothetical protein PENSPDRAFT_748260 [Peniophora sp. CONT]|nr:hypothetical protein PENSPDRAFT_748260 [Peniophora sp. CONT]
MLIQQDDSDFGLAELSAYLAYDDPVRRDNATWYHWGAIYNNSFISAADAESNKFSHNLTTTAACGETLGGMIFMYGYSDIQDVWSRALGPWILLSSQLADITKESIYLQAAELSIQFMQSHMLNLTAEGASIVAHTFNASTCEPSFNSSTSADLAQFIEGLSIVANITQNQNYTQLLFDLIPLAVRAWTNPQGIMFENASLDIGKGYMVRSLLEAKHRNPSNTAINDLIDAFINVQFNAVRTNANLTNNNYNSSWIGPAHSSGPYDLAGGILALHVLNAASAMAPPDQSFANHSAGSSTNIRAIVGAVVGGVAGVVACVLIGLIYLRRNRARELPLHEDAVELSTPAKAEGVVEPYMLTGSGTQPPANSKGGASYTRMVDLSPTGDSDVTAQSAQSDSDGPSAAVDHGPDVVSGLARRLDNLIDALAIRGEVDGLPPDYETRAARSDVASHQ